MLWKVFDLQRGARIVEAAPKRTLLSQSNEAGHSNFFETSLAEAQLGSQPRCS